MTISAILDQLADEPDAAGRIVHVQHTPARAARYADPERPLPPELLDALRRLGIERLYAHQARAIDLARAGHDVLVATGTSSGKTLCYNAPVLEAALAEPLSRALYLHPTKALAQDQLRVLRALTRDTATIRAATYDGDTPSGSRSQIRRSASIVLTNPDMLHRSILPHHATWGAFLRHLRYVVLDEAHTYRGVFGSHVALVLRRLRRVCREYGSDPKFLLTSATLANPAEHAERLTGRPVRVLEGDGAPASARHYAVWNPPLLDAERGRRASVHTEAVHLLTALVRSGVRTIAFVRTRKAAELLLLYMRQSLGRNEPALVEGLAAYRGGYLPTARREIERRLQSGELLAVTATNALELGMDIGGIDAVLQVGYPGTIASLRQQAGRAGRGLCEGLAILIGDDNPLDQYYMRHPEELFRRPHEAALINPANPYIAMAQLRCAAYELPLAPDDAPLFGEAFPAAVAALEEAGELVEREGRRWSTSTREPAADVGIRGTSGRPVLLVDEAEGYRLLEEIDVESAPFRVHPGAIHLHRAEAYLVTHLDLESGVAFARPTEDAYYTRPLEHSSVRIVRSRDARAVGPTHGFWGTLRVTQQVVGFSRVEPYSGQTLSTEELDLPAQSYETEGLWFEVPAPVLSRLGELGLDAEGGLHAVEHATIAVLPLFAMCDRDDIGGLSTVQHPDTGRAQVFVYDGHPGGVGIARQGFDVLPALWERVLDVVRGCPCLDGCPSCIQSPKCGSNNIPLDKRAAVIILEDLLRPAGDPT